MEGRIVVFVNPCHVRPRFTNVTLGLYCVIFVVVNTEMEMARESRARDAKEGVDRNACIVDRQQFFNTQVLNFEETNVVFDVHIIELT